MTEPATDRPPLDLVAAHGRARRVKEWLDESARQLTGQGWLPLSVREFFARDIPRVLAEVTALRAELDAARAYVALHLSPECQHTNAHDGCDETVVCKGRCWCTCHDEDAARAKPTTDDGSDVGATFDPREPLMPRAARAKRTEPAMGEDVDVDALARKVAEYRAHLWHYDRTLDSKELVNWIDNHIASDGHLEPDIRVVLAALDLPGRERALREEIEELAGELAEERTLHDATNAALAKERAEHERALYNTHKRGWNEALRRNSG